MSVATNPYSSTDPQTTAADAGTEPRPTTFTAANDLSPSRHDSGAGSDRLAQAGNEDHTGSESELSMGKRKTARSISSGDISPKRPRTSSPLRHAPYPSAQQHHQMDASSWAAQQDGHDSTTSDARLAQVLTNGMSGQSVGSISMSPEQTTHPRHSLQGEGYDYSRDLDPQTPQSGPGSAQRGGQRKRVFSNRTKTGCLTCRNRKKKCDEAKPMCENCKRGGFQCKGYNSTSSGLKTTIPQQSLQPQHQQQQQHQPQQPYPAYQYPPPPPPPAQYYESSAPPRSSMSGPSQDPRMHQAYGHQQWPLTQSHYPQDPMQRPEYQQLPTQSLPSQPMAMPDMSRATPMGRPPPPEPIHPRHDRTHSQSHPSLYGQHTSGASTSSSQYNNLRTTAQLASNTTPPTARTPPKTEKEKMLQGFPFNSRDPELRKEQHACQKQIYRFNKDAIKPDTPSDIARQLFRAILDSSSSDPSSATSPTASRKIASASASAGEKLTGTVGKNVEVMPPFNCEYGYNIHIGEECDIGANCRIMDNALVEIGARTIIGPNVMILTLDGDHTDNKRIRAGQKRLLKAQKVVIGSDCFIGAGAIVLPGRTLPAGSTVGAGTVVSKSPSGPGINMNLNQMRMTKTHWASE